MDTKITEYINKRGGKRGDGERKVKARPKERYGGGRGNEGAGKKWGAARGDARREGLRESVATVRRGRRAKFPFERKMKSRSSSLLSCVAVGLNQPLTTSRFLSALDL